MKRGTIGIISGVALATGGIVLGLANPASAAVIWDWNYSGLPQKGGSGTFTTTDEQSDGSFLITDITGTSEGQTITSLLPPGSFAGNTNVLFGSFPQFSSFAGVAYAVGGVPYKLAWDPFNFRYTLSEGGFPFPDLLRSFSAIARVTPPATVPEPGSLIGYITLGGLMLGSALRKARHSSP